MAAESLRPRPAGGGAVHAALGSALPGGVLVVLLLALLSLGCAGGPESRSAADLTNPSLSPAYAQWLVGAIAHLATPEEEREFLALTDDFAAIDFIEAFWQRRDPEPSEPGNPVRETLERRAREADRMFSEAGVSGRKTARGVIHILYGPPERTDYEISPRGGPAIEVWFYPDDAPPGLDGRRPDASYRFQKVGEVTTLYRRGGPPVRPGRPD